MGFKNLYCIIICFLVFRVTAQEDSLNLQSKINISGFLDVFYAYDFNKPEGNKRQNFLYNHNRHNEFNVNLAYIKLNIEDSNYRANLAFHSGTYVTDNYANENPLLKNIFEANVGLALNKNKSLWLDAGILPSYIGFESALSCNNSTLTRSLLAENSPYFFSGAKLTYQASKKLSISGIVLNGWQRIQRLQGNSLPSFGSQIQYTNPKTVINWSTFIGSDYPDSTRKFRYFNNLYWQQKIFKNWEIIAGLDLGCEQKIKNSNAYNFWYSPVFITQYTLATHWKTAFRAEYFSDKNGVIILNNSPFGFKTSGFSINLDYVPRLNILARMEARWLHSAHPIFTSHNTLLQNNFFITSSLSIKFN